MKYMKEMSSIRIILIGISVVGMLTTVSCSKNVFDEEKYKEIVEIVSPVDSVDHRHTWELTREYSYVVKADAGVNAREVMILQDDPLTSTSSEVMAKGELSSGELTLRVTVPTRLTELYAALVDEDGLYTVVSFPVTASTVSFADVASSHKQKQVRAQIVPQQLMYCFEEEMPEPGDYDFNDVVLRVSREVVSSRQVKLNVELMAVGASKQLGAGIRLVGYQFADVDSVTTDNGESFTKGGANHDLDEEGFIDEIWESSDLLQRSRQGEAVICLFNDAHWATGDNIDVANNGVVTRKKYNVSKSFSTDFTIVPNRMVSYNIYLKEGRNANDLTLSSLDPFVLVPYSNATLEVHCYKYRAAQVMREYSLTDVLNLPWALMIPYSSFRYPLHGINIGFSKGDSFFGAYMTPNHAFGQWVRNYESTLDWYLYPTFNQIF